MTQEVLVFKYFDAVSTLQNVMHLKLQAVQLQEVYVELGVLRWYQVRHRQTVTCRVHTCKHTMFWHACGCKVS